MKKNSFSLIEVVFACTVIILFLMAGIIVTSNLVKGEKVSIHRMQATLLSSQRINEIRRDRDNSYFAGLAPTMPVIGITTTCFTEQLVGAACPSFFYRTTTISALSFSATDRKVQVDVGWTDYYQSKIVTAYTYIINWQNL